MGPADSSPIVGQYARKVAIDINKQNTNHFLLKEFMYSYCCICTCILIVRPRILIVVYVFLLFVHVFLLLSMYSYRCLCTLIVVYVFLDAATLTEVSPCFFLGCKANARV